MPFDTRIFHKECRTLVAAGYRVSLVASHGRAETVGGVEMVPLPVYSRRAARIALSPWRVFRLARALKADLYHFHDPELLPVGVLLKWTTGARVIYDAHENYAQQMAARGWMPAYLRGLVPWLVGRLEQAAVRAFDAVVCATEHIAALFPQAKALVVKNYPLFDLTARPLSERPYAADNCRIIYTGGWSGHRGVCEIVEALGYVKNPDVRLSLLGRCPDPHVQERASRLPGYAKVDYYGMLPYDQLYEQLQAAAVGMVCNQPRHDYDLAQPNKLFEYMSAGLPVIASNFPLWREIVAGNQCGLMVDPTQPSAIAEAIDHLLANPETRRQMGANGRQAILTRYNWTVEGQKLVDLYDELLYFRQ
ncbi:MAG: glycosyltransferase family 4 protein [Chloroflexota bacterium]